LFNDENQKYYQKPKGIIDSQSNPKFSFSPLG